MAAAAAAVLRYAAKRLGGRALQRPQRNYTAAADNIQGRRTVRPTSSSRCTPNSSTKHACVKFTEEPLAQKSKEYLASTQKKDIESKTEELFHLIAKMDKELPAYCNKDNRQLLMHLSVLVQPKPDDPQWRFYRRAVTVNKYVFYGSALGLAYLALSSEISQLYDLLVE